MNTVSGLKHSGRSVLAKTKNGRQARCFILNLKRIFTLLFFEDVVYVVTVCGY